MVDATIIEAPTSTRNKNKNKQRDPEMYQTRKGNLWHFGMKVHIGTDVNSGAVHSVTTAAANIADITKLQNLLHESDQVIFANAGYTSGAYK